MRRRRGEPQQTPSKAELMKEIAAVRQQQHTGNHEHHESETPEPYGADVFGGTRAGAENVEPKK